MRQFETGATRDSDDGKLDYEGFLSPLVLERFALYMQGHRVQADGGIRASDNWQKGIPQYAYMKSMLRHVMDVWLRWRSMRTGWDFEEALCAVLFNVQGMLHEILKAKGVGVEPNQENVYIGTHAGPSGAKLSSFLRGGEPTQPLGLLSIQPRRYGLPDPAYHGHSDPRLHTIDF